ncbi:MAG: helix-turn-helix domain-containing protein, partial [Anaerovoracaceae bacterium]
ILLPLKGYDNKYHSNLLETILTFVENEMDYAKTSKTMYVHENTIRYRLGKAKNLIPYGCSDLDFQNTLYIFFKIYKLKQFT